MTSQLSEISNVAQDYLKVIWTAREWDDDVAVTSKIIAEKLRVAPSTVSENLRRLVERDLVSHAPYGSVGLTDAGRELALKMVRRHRLLECYLMESLDYGWDEVHEEAEILEHAVSDLFIDRIDAVLGRPRRDPHGDPIPSADGDVWRPAAVPLSALGPGEQGDIARVADAEADILRYFDSLDLVLDAHVLVTERLEHAGVLSVTVGGSSSVTIGTLAAAAIWVVPA